MTGTDDLRSVAHTLGSRARPGDAVIFHNPGGGLITAAHPSAFHHVRDIARSAGAPSMRQWFGLEPSALYGHDVGPGVLHQRLGTVSRLWVIRLPRRRPPHWYSGPAGPHGFCAQRTWQLHGDTVTLYHRCRR